MLRYYGRDHRPPVRAGPPGEAAGARFARPAETSQPLGGFRPRLRASRAVRRAWSSVVPPTPSGPMAVSQVGWRASLVFPSSRCPSIDRRARAVRGTIARAAVRQAGGARADRRRLGARSAARPAVEGHRPRGLRRPGGRRCARCSSGSAVSRRSARASPSTRSATIDVALPRRESKVGRGHRGFLVEGDPAMSVDEASRRRDFTINAISWDPLTDEYLDPARRPRGPRRPRPPRRRSAPRSPTTACACCGRCSSSPGSSCPSRPTRVEICRAIALDDLPSERIWGEFEKLLLLAGAPVASASRFARDAGDRPAPAARRWRRSSGASRSRSGIPEGDVWAHTLMVIDQARAPHRRPAAVGEAGRDAGRGVPRLRQARRPRRSSTAGSARTTTRRPACAPARALLDRLNVHAIDGVDVRTQVFGLTAHHLKPGVLVQGARRGGRRRVPPARAEGGSRTAGPAGRGRLRGPRRASSTAPR